MQKKMLLFDIDGTLLLTGGAGRIAFERAFEEMYSLAEVWQSLRPDGKTDPIIIEELATRELKRPLKPEEYEELCRKYNLYFEEELPRSDRFRLMPGIPELLRDLSSKSEYHLGIATGNFEFTARLKLKHAGLESFFSFGGYGSDSHDRAELTRLAFQRGQEMYSLPLDAEHAVVIGDTIHDVRAGKALGAKTVAVGTGSSTEEELREAGADIFFKDLTDIPAFLACVNE